MPENQDENLKRLNEIKSLDKVDEAYQDLATELLNQPEFKDVPKEKLELIIKKIDEHYSEEEHYSYESNLPHPTILKGYEGFYPGVTKVIIDNYISEGQHRRIQEQKIVESEINSTKLGQWLALFVVTMVLSSVCYCAYIGSTASTIIGSIVGVGGLAALAYTFIQGRKKE